MIRKLRQVLTAPVLASLALSWLGVVAGVEGCSGDAEDVPWQGVGANSQGGAAGGVGGQAGAGEAGSGEAGAPMAGQGSQAGQGGNSSCSEADAHLVIASPVDNSTVTSPVTFRFEATCSTFLRLYYDGMEATDFSWDSHVQPTATWSHEFAPGNHEVKIEGMIYAGSNMLPPSVVHFTVEEAPVDVCDGVDTSQFFEPSVCNGPGGRTSKEIPQNDVYSTSWFGCYRKDDGTIYKDPYDNCEFACGNKGLCDASDSGPECEANLKWFAADADRYGCGGRIQVTNCANHKSVVLVTLDRGPNCVTVEQKYHVPALDMSHDAMMFLFGKSHGASDKAAVVVKKVDDNTPLGPVN